MGGPVLLRAPSGACAVAALRPRLVGELEGASPPVCEAGLDVALSLWGGALFGTATVEALPLALQRHGLPAARILVAVAGVVPQSPPPGACALPVGAPAVCRAARFGEGLPLAPPPHPVACAASPAAAPLVARLLHGQLLAPGQVVALPLLGAGGVEDGGGTLGGWVMIRVWEGGDGRDGEGAPALFRVHGEASACEAAPPPAAGAPPPLPPRAAAAATAAALRAAVRLAPGCGVCLGAAAAATGAFLRGARARAGVLLAGPPGAGKSRVAEALAAASGLPVLRTCASALYRGEAGASEGAAAALWARARAAAASPAGGAVVVVEDADALLPAAPRSPLARRVASLLLAAMDDTAPRGVAWLAVTSRPGAVTCAALGPRRLRAAVALAPPTLGERAATLRAGVNARLRALVAAGGGGGGGAVVRLRALRAAAHAAAERAPGASRADLAALCAAGVRAAEGGGGDAGGWWRAAARAAPPAALSRAPGGPPRPAPLRGAGARGRARPAAAVRAAIGAALLPLALGAAGVCPRGLLLCGPPGTGKTELAHALAHAARARGLANALVLAGTDIVSPLVGSSEAALAAAFAAARALRPALLVVDHFEALAARREGAALHEDRLLSVLLTELDGVAGGGGVTLVAVTRDPALLDPAVLRPGRLDLRVSTALPDAAARCEVLRDCGATRAHAAVVERIVAASEGDSHAGVVARWRDAAMRALRRAMAAGVAAGSAVEVTLEDVS